MLQIAPKRSGGSEINAEEYRTGYSSPKRSKQDEREQDPSFAEITFDIDIIYSKDKRKETIQYLIKHIVALLNSAGGVIRINESQNDKNKIIKQRDTLMQGLEDALVDILTKNEYKQCIHFVAYKFPYCYFFVRKSKRVCTQSSGLKIPLESKVFNASTYIDISNIINPKAKSDSVSERESSSSEMSDEDMEVDSGYPNDTPMSNFPDEKHEFQFKKKVSFSESSTVQFKLIDHGRASKGDVKVFLKGIDKYLPNYVSAFANGHGGKVYFGIDDDGTVKGQLVDGKDWKKKVEETVEKVMTRKNEEEKMVRIWGTPGFMPKYNEQWSVKFVEIIGTPEGEERFVVVVKIFSFDGGMFLEHPLACKIDENSEKIVPMDFVEWRNLHSFDSVEDYAEVLKRMEPLTLDDLGKRVYQLKNMTKKFAENVFPDKRNLKLIPENFAERFKTEKEKDCIQHIEKILQRTTGKGFAMFDKSWSVNVDIVGPAPDEIICDILVMSQTDMPRMITIARELSEEIKKYNHNLAKKLKSALVGKGSCLECFGVDAQVILLNDINDRMQLPHPNVCYPPAYKMTQELFNKIREALVVVLAAFETSSFNPRVGIRFLYVLTPEQYDISIKEDPCVVVSAPPGTGKTVVAMERIKRLYKSGVRSEEILYICENKSLVSFIWTELRGKCRPITRAKFMSEIRKGYDAFNCVRHVVVDEAQNFRNEAGVHWLQSILRILNWQTDSQQHHDNTLYIFCDQLQKIRKQFCGLSIVDSQGPNSMSNLFPTVCRLNTVIRNSRKIYEEWEKIALNQPDMGQNRVGIGHDYEGRDVNVVRLSSYDQKEIFSTAKETIDTILHNKIYKASDVAVLFNTKDMADHFTEYIQESNNINVTDAEEFPRRNLVVDSIRRFSGLEAPVVIAVRPFEYSDYEDAAKFKIFLYSRAMVEFHIIE